MLDFSTRISPAVIRGIREEKRGNLQYIKFIVVLGEADGAFISLTKRDFQKILKLNKFERKKFNVMEWEGKTCYINLINNRKVIFTGFGRSN